MMKAVLLVALLGVAAVAALSESEYQWLFTRWIEEHGKEYEVEHIFDRYNVFKANLDVVIEHNSNNHSYTLAINSFADMTDDEFAASRCGYIAKPRNPSPVEYNGAIDANIDWLAAGAVTAVKEQGECVSGWAFSATGALEGCVHVASKKLISVSEQQLLDCSGGEGNEGCNGGLMDYAYQYIIKNGGVGTSESYPYTARNGSCKQVPSVSKMSGFKDVPPRNEGQLLTALQLGPVSVAVEADKPVWRFYHDGVLDNAGCGTTLDHGVTLVGSGTLAGKDYWKVKNSWGTVWGKEGYILLVRNKNQCGISQAASYGTGCSAV